MFIQVSIRILKILIACLFSLRMNSQDACTCENLVTENDYGILDLHCHPSFKRGNHMHRLWGPTYPMGHINVFMNILAMQTKAEEIKRANYKGMLVSHMLVEAPLIRESATLKNAVNMFFPVNWFLKTLALGRYVQKIEHEDSTNIDQIMSIINTFESDIDILNKKKCPKGKPLFQIAKSYDDYCKLTKEGKVAYIHAVEGGHNIGRNMPLTIKGKNNSKLFVGRMHKANGQSTQNQYLENLIKLRDKGVCMITLAHLFENDLAYCVDGIGYQGKKTLKVKTTYHHSQNNYPLTPIGEEFVKKMLQLGVIVELTHCTPAAREQIFKLNTSSGTNKRPVVFSHVGADSIFQKYNNECNQGLVSNFRFYNVTDEEILHIESCGGVIGVIPDNFWLVAFSPSTNKCKDKDFKNGINYVIETIEYINSRTLKKDYSSVGIGTDFDGLTDMPHDMYHGSQTSALIDRIKAIPNITDDQVKKILHGNVERVLKFGWGAPRLNSISQCK